MSGFKKINDKQFCIAGEEYKIFTIKEDLKIECRGILIFSDNDGYELTRFCINDFKNFISAKYNGDENWKSYIRGIKII